MNSTHVPRRALGSSPASLATPIVFVVDDDASVCKSLELLVGSECWRPETFPSPQDFLEPSPAPVPNCLVLALSLPGLNGPDLLKRLAIERLETPIIFVTNRGNVPTTVQAIKAGAVEFLTKRFRDDSLLTAIRDALERNRFALGQEAEMRVVRNCYASLSPRKRQVMGLLVAGLLNKQVGAEPSSEHTVKVLHNRPKSQRTRVA